MLISKNVRKEYLKLNEKNKNFRITINWLGFKMTSIPININLRKHDKSKFDFFTLVKLGINIFSSFSIFPIKIVGYLGLIMTTISFCILLLFSLNIIIKYTIISWQTYFILVQIFLIGLCMISIGFLGLYVIKILDNTNNRPSYIIEKEIY
jgi:dolichol-phosphate mannosyltransferase